MQNCPYCDQRKAITKDHIFPQFLGGNATIPCCKTCNDRFGHSFEGAVSQDLAPIIVLLSFSGYKHKRVVVYKNAWIDESTGIEYDLDSERRTYPTKPYFIEGVGNTRSVIARNLSEAQRIAASLKEKGNEIVEIGQVELKNRQPPLKSIRFHIGAEIRQLAVKMCVAVSQRISPNDTVASIECRDFLLDETPVSSPVRQIQSTYPELDSLRPPLAHTVYVEADSISGTCYGIVQFFGGVFQFYVPLNSSYTGKSFAALATLNVTSFEEQIQEILPLHLPEAPLSVDVATVYRSLNEMGTYLNEQVKEAFGRNGIIFGAAPKQTLSAMQVSIPILWIEYTLVYEMKLDLVPDREPDSDLVIANDPRSWMFSADFGETSFSIIDSFVQKWNNRELERIANQKHDYVPEEIVPGTRLLLGKDFWCPVHSLTISYEVKPSAWLGSIALPAESGELDLSQQIAHAEGNFGIDNIPTIRDLTWPSISDPEGYIASVENILIIEPEIHIDSLRFTNPDFRLKG